MLVLLTILASPALGADVLVGPTQANTTLLDGFNNALDGDRILVDPGVYSSDRIDITAETFTVAAAQGLGSVTIELISDNEFFEVRNGGELTLQGLDFDGRVLGRIVDIRDGALTIEDCIARDAHQDQGDDGAVIQARDTVVTISGSTLQGSVTGAPNGGLIEMDNTTLVLRGTTLRFGLAQADGGAIEGINGSSAVIEDCSFEFNGAANGSAVSIDGGDLVFRGNRLVGNAADSGTVRCLNAASCIVEDSHFEANNANTLGGALQAEAVVSTSFNRNTVCSSMAGGRLVDLANTSATFERNIFFDNVLSDALILVDANSSANLVNNHFVTATASTDGGVLRTAGSVVFTNNLVAYNSGVNAVVAAANGTLVATYNLFYDNTDTDADVALDASNLLDTDPVIGLGTGDCEATALIPAATSPAIDAGDPAIFDTDGSVADIGAFGDLQTVDADGDGFDSREDCDDFDANTNPSMTEIPCNFIDDDCSDLTPDRIDEDNDGVSTCDDDCDDTNPNRSTMEWIYKDADMDGFGVGNAVEVCGIPNNGSLVDGDCDDDDPDTYPGAEEILYDGIDQDCDGADRDDIDGDGVIGPEDCNDRNPDRYPGAKDVPEDGIDQDCTGFDAALAVTGGAGLNCGGCSTQGRSIGWIWLPLLLVLARRRRAIASRGHRRIQTRSWNSSS